MYLHNTDTLLKKQNIINLIKENDINFYNFYKNEIDEELNYYKYYLNIRQNINLINYIKKFVLIRNFLYNKYNIHNDTQINNLCLVIKMCNNNVSTLKDIINGYGFIIENNNIIYIKNENFIDTFNLTLDKLNTDTDYYLIEDNNLYGGNGEDEQKGEDKKNIINEENNQEIKIKVIPENNMNVIIAEINNYTIPDTTNIKNKYKILFGNDQFSITNTNKFYLYNDLKIYETNKSEEQIYKIISLYQRIETLKHKLQDRFKDTTILNNIINIFEAYEYCINYLSTMDTNVMKQDADKLDELNPYFQFNLDFSGTSLIYADYTNCINPVIYTTTFSLSSNKIPITEEDKEKIKDLRYLNTSLFDDIFVVPKNGFKIDEIPYGITDDALHNIILTYCDNIDLDEIKKEDNIINKYIDIIKQDVKYKEIQEDNKIQIYYIVKVLFVYFLTKISYSINDYILVTDKNKYKSIDNDKFISVSGNDVNEEYYNKLFVDGINNNGLNFINTIYNKSLFEYFNLNNGGPITLNIYQYLLIYSLIPHKDKENVPSTSDIINVRKIDEYHFNKHNLLQGGEDKTLLFHSQSLYNFELITDDYINFIINGYGIKIDEKGEIKVENPNFLIYLYSITDEVLKKEGYTFISYLPSLNILKAYFNGEIKLIQQQEVINEYEKIQITYGTKDDDFYIIKNKDNIYETPIINVFIKRFFQEKKEFSILKDNVICIENYTSESYNPDEAVVLSMIDNIKPIILIHSFIKKNLLYRFKSLPFQKDYKRYIEYNAFNEFIVDKNNEEEQCYFQIRKYEISKSQIFQHFSIISYSGIFYINDYLKILKTYNITNYNLYYLFTIYFNSVEQTKSKILKDSKITYPVYNNINDTSIYNTLIQIINVYNNASNSELIDILYLEGKSEKEFDFYIKNIYYILMFINNYFRIYEENIFKDLINITEQSQAPNEKIKYDCMKILYKPIYNQATIDKFYEDKQIITVYDRIYYVLCDLQFYISYVYLTKILNYIKPVLGTSQNEIIILYNKFKRYTIAKYNDPDFESYYLTQIQYELKPVIELIDIIFNDYLLKDIFILFYKSNNTYINDYLEFIFTNVLEYDISINISNISDDKKEKIKEEIKKIKKNPYKYVFFNELIKIIQNNNIKNLDYDTVRKPLIEKLNTLLTSKNEEKAKLNPTVYKLFDLTKKLKKTLEGSYLYINGGIDFINKYLHEIKIQTSLTYYQTNYLQITEDFMPNIYGDKLTNPFDCIVFMLLNNNFITEYINSYQWVIDIQKNILNNTISFKDTILYDLLIFYNKCQYYNKISTKEKIYNYCIDDKNNVYDECNDSLFNKYYNKSDNIYDLFKSLIDKMYNQTLNNIFIRQIHYIYIKDNSNDIIINKLAFNNRFDITINNELLVFCIPHNLINFNTTDVNIQIPKSIQLENLYKIKYCVVYNLYKYSTGNITNNDGYYSIYIFDENNINCYDNNNGYNLKCANDTDLNINYIIPICNKHTEMIVYEKIDTEGYAVSF